MIRCLHTSAVHVATFDALLAGQAVEHVVREDLLARARGDGLASVAQDTRAALAEMATEGATVLCTCSTLGPLADAAGVLRIDRPAMEAAAAGDGTVIIAICLESTRDATLALWEEIAGPGRDALVLCDDAWRFFEAGDMTGFGDAITAKLCAVAEESRTVLLAQASMAVAENALKKNGFQVFTTPGMAAARATELAQNQR